MSKCISCGKKKLVLEFDDTPANRAALMQLAGHAHDDEASFFEDDSLKSPGNPDPEMEQAFRNFNDVVTLALHPEIKDWPTSPDFLDEVIQERSVKNPEFPKLVEEAVARRKQKREQAT